MSAASSEAPRPTSPEETDRDVFDRVRAHLLRQGQRAMFSGQCQYRTEGPLSGQTLRCAVGCLVPDDVYDPKMEGRPVTSHTVASVLDRAGVRPEDPIRVRMLATLQGIHDRVDPGNWAEALAIAEAEALGDGSRWHGHRDLADVIWRRLEGVSIDADLGATP